MSDNERIKRVGKLFDWPVMLASLAVIPVLMLEGSSLPSPWPEIGATLNWISWLVFLVETVVMVRVAGFRWLKENPLPLLVTILSPPFAPAGLAILRFLRLLRLLPGLRVARRLFTLQGVQFAALVALLTIIAGGLAFSRVEQAQDLDYSDGIWWALTTVTTVGYGDLSPTTDVGRILAASIMFVGIGFVALLTAFVAERFITGRNEEEEIESRVLCQLEAIEERLQSIELSLHGGEVSRSQQEQDMIPARPPSNLRP